MAQYIITKQFIMGKKIYYKDKILPDGISKDLIKRLVAKGFVKNIDEASEALKPLEKPQNIKNSKKNGEQ